VQRGTQRQLALARQAVPAQLAQVQAQARQQLRDARHLSASGWAQVLERSRSGLALAREALHHEHTDLGRLARLSLGQARQHSQALMREIAGQGPDKTLGRGFALVRQADTGQALTAAAQAAPGARLTLQFHDGGLAVVVPPVRPDTP
jgi:exodeoxyribonuclease VII large subunit